MERMASQIDNEPQSKVEFHQGGHESSNRHTQKKYRRFCKPVDR